MSARSRASGSASPSSVRGRGSTRISNKVCAEHVVFFVLQANESAARGGQGRTGDPRRSPRATTLQSAVVTRTALERSQVTAHTLRTCDSHVLHKESYPIYCQYYCPVTPPLRSAA